MFQRKYKKGGDAGSKGVRFQINLLTLFLLKAIRKLRDWRLSTENNEAGKFDDVVLEWPDGVVLLQAKYRDNKKTITFDELLSTNTKKDDFSLPKYFISYQEIKCRFQVKSVIVCTNASVDKKAFEFINRRKASPESMLYYEEGTCLVYTFNDNILPGLIDKTKIFLQQCRNKNIDESVITDENLRDFLEHLQFYFNYPSGEDIENINGKLLSVAKDINDIYNEISSSDVHSKIMDWFQQKDGEYLTEIRTKAMFLEIKRDTYFQKLEQYNVFLQSNSLNFSSPERIFHIVADEGHLLQEIQVFRALQEIKKVLCVCPESSIEELSHTLRAFELPSYTFIVIIWPKFMGELQAKEVTSKLKQILDNYHYKKVVLVTESKSELARQCQSTFLNLDVIKESVIWDDLKEETQKILSTKKIINFQGNIFNLDELFAPNITQNYGAALNPEILEKLVRGEEVAVGRRVQILDPHIDYLYVNRTFTRNERKMEEGDIFEVNEKVILISDSPGMGKSTVLTNLAIAIKNKYPHLWVIKIVLGDYTGILKSYCSDNRGTLTVPELLDSQNETKFMHHFEKFVFSLNHRIILLLDGFDEISPNYTDLIENLLIQSRQATNYEKIFVTTRLHMTEELENKLKVKSFKLQPFTEQNQVDFLTNYWTCNLKLDSTNKAKSEKYARALLSAMCFWVNSYQNEESRFSSIPLQVRMLAEIFQERTRLNESQNWEGCKEYLGTREEMPKLPKQIYFAKLFKMFLDKKRIIFLDKGNPTGNAKADLALNKQFDEYLAYHRALALEVILDKQECELFADYKEHEEHIKTGVFDVGIVQLNNGNRFIHRTFAEYFCAKCVVRELQCQNQNVEFQKFFIDQLLRMAKYKVVCVFLDSCLQEVVSYLPSNIFQKYQSLTFKMNFGSVHPFYLIHELAGNGYVAILQLLLKCLGFKIIENKETTFTHLLCESNKDEAIQMQIICKEGGVSEVHIYGNTLNILRFYIHRGGINITDYNGALPLHWAIRGGCLDMVNFLVERGANINRTEKLTHLLSGAVQRGHVDMVKFLVNQGVNIKAKDEQNYGILYEAISRNRISIVEYLLKKILKVDDLASKDTIVSFTAAYLGRLDILEKLLKGGVFVDDRIHNGMTLIFGAAQGGQLDTIRYLVQQGADINSKDYSGDTPLHIISDNSSLIWTSKLLIELGIDIHAKNHWGETALHKASKEGNLDTVQLLIDSGINVNSEDEDGVTALISSCATSQSIKIVKFLVEHGANIDARDRWGCSALYFAAKNGNLNIVKCLLKFGADVNVRTHFDYTTLHSAVFSLRLDVVKTLVQHGVNVNFKDYEGCTALHLAILSHQLHIVKFLLEFGVDVNTKNNEGCSVLHSAAAFNTFDTVRLLIKHGVDLSVTDRAGRMALHLAAATTNSEIVRLLVESDVDINAKDNDGCTALHLSVEFCSLQSIELLLMLGAWVDIKDNKGRTALHLAVLNAHWDAVVKYCEKNDIKSKLFYERIYENRLLAVTLLIEHGADTNAKDFNGDTVATLIKKNGNQDLFKYIDLELLEKLD